MCYYGRGGREDGAVQMKENEKVWSLRSELVVIQFAYSLSGVFITNQKD